MTPINSLPYTISGGGAYRLNTSVDTWNASAGPIITVAADDVVLDGSGCWMIDSYGTTKQMVGVYGLNRSRVYVTGMTVFGPGLRYAIHFENTDDFTSVGRIVVENCPRLGANFRAVRVEGKNSVVRNNGILNVSGATWTTNPYCFGVEVLGPDPVVTGNTIHEVYGSGTGESVGVALTKQCTNALVRGNIIRNQSKVTASIAVWVGGNGNDASEGASVMDNVMENYKRCMLATAQTGVAQGNIHRNCGPLTGETSHDLFDIPGTDSWTGSDANT